MQTLITILIAVQAGTIIISVLLLIIFWKLAIKWTELIKDFWVSMTEELKKIAESQERQSQEMTNFLKYIKTSGIDHD